MCVTIYPLVGHIPLCNLSPPSSSKQEFMSSFLMVHFHVCPKEKPSKLTKEYNPLGYFTVQVSEIPNLFHLWSRWWWMGVAHRCVKICVALAIMVLVCEKVLMAFRATLVQNTKLKLSKSRLKRKQKGELRARWEKRRGHWSSFQDIWGCLFFSSFSWRNAALWGEAASWSGASFVVHVMRLDNSVFSTFFFFKSTTKCVCVYWQLQWLQSRLTGCLDFLCITNSFCVQLRHHVWALFTSSLGQSPRLFPLFPHKISQDRGAWGPGSEPKGKLVPPPGSAVV